MWILCADYYDFVRDINVYAFKRIFIEQLEFAVSEYF